jgi:2-(1,2-epoxy-1,2-dihydrophenyl)acetyl-CoA isomerase
LIKAALRGGDRSEMNGKAGNAAAGPPGEPGTGEQSTGQFSTVELSVSDGVGVLRLNRPETRNALDPAVAEDLHAAALRCAADPELKALLICAAGSHFTVGADIRVLAGSDPDDLQLAVSRYHEALQILDKLQVPVVAAVQGAVAGGGLGLMCVADIVLAAAGTRFATGFASLGLAGDGGSTWFLPRLVGTRRAAEMLLEQRVLDATEAADWGLITRVVPAGELQEQAERVAGTLAAGPARALGELRALLRRSPASTLREQMIAETDALARTTITPDAADAIRSFITRAGRA